MTFDPSCGIHSEESYFPWAKLFLWHWQECLGILNSPCHGCVLCYTNAFKWYSHPVGQLSKHCLDDPKWTYFKFCHYKRPTQPKPKVCGPLSVVLRFSTPPHFLANYWEKSILTVTEHWGENRYFRNQSHTFILSL